MNDVTTEISRELEKARQARALGLEGRARVCARRAAGLAVRNFLQLRGVDCDQKSAYSLLQKLLTLEHLSYQSLTCARHLLLRVDEQFQLPPDVDLIADAENLINAISRED